MKKSLKRSVLLLVLALMISVVFMPKEASAATKKYMKKQNVSWDIKKGKTITYKNYFVKVGLVNEKAKITQYKVSKSNIPGYKRVTMKIKFLRSWKPTVKQIDKMVNSDYSRRTKKIGGGVWVHVVDYNTGRSLWRDSRFVISCNWTSLPTKYYYGTNGNYVWFTPQVCQLVVDYPKNYKGLCIGFSGTTSVNEAKDEKFTNGKIAIGKTRFVSKKTKKVAHFKRVTK